MLIHCPRADPSRNQRDLRQRRGGAGGIHRRRALGGMATASLARRSGDFAPLPLGLAVIVLHIRPFIAPAPTAVAATLYAKFWASDRQSRSDRHRSGRRIHHRQRGRDRDRHRLCLSAHRRRGVLPDRGDGSHHSGHGTPSSPFRAVFAISAGRNRFKPSIWPGAGPVM